MANIVGTPAADTLTATAADDRLIGLGGNDLLRSNFEDMIMNGGSGKDQLRQTVNLDDVVSYSDGSFFKAGSGDDRVVLQTAIDAGDDSEQPNPGIRLFQDILTEGGDDFVFVSNRISSNRAELSGLENSAVSIIKLTDTSGDNQITLRNDIFTLLGVAEAQTDVSLGRGDDVVRYTGSTTSFESNAQSCHTFRLGEGDNRLTYRDTTGDLDFVLTSGSGRDVINIRYQIDDPATIGLDGNFVIFTGDGDDVVVMDLRGVAGFGQSAQSAINLGDGNNFLRMTQDILGPIDVTAGDGNDRFVLSIDGSGGLAFPEFPFDIDVDLSGGDNRVTVDLNVGTSIQGINFNLSTGTGEDRIDFLGAFDRDEAVDGPADTFLAQMDTGAGNDQINVKFADLTLTTGDGADIVRFDQSAITEVPFDESRPSHVLNPGHNTLVLTDFDFEAGDRFIFTGFEFDGLDTTMRSVADLEAIVGFGDALSLNNTFSGDLVLEVAGDDGLGFIVFEGLGEPIVDAIL